MTPRYTTAHMGSFPIEKIKKDGDSMSVILGTIDTFPNPKADKAQVLKIGEECMEVFSAWETVNGCVLREDGQCLSQYNDGECNSNANCIPIHALVDECADVIQATCNLLAALGVDDMRAAMQACRARNVERGRL